MKDPSNYKEVYRELKDFSNYKKVYKDYGHLIGSLVEFTNQLSKEKALGMIVGISKHSLNNLWCCFDIEFYSPAGYNVSGHIIRPSVSEVLHNTKAFRIIS